MSTGRRMKAMKVGALQVEELLMLLFWFLLFWSFPWELLVVMSVVDRLVRTCSVSFGLDDCNN